MTYVEARRIESKDYTKSRFDDQGTEHRENYSVLDNKKVRTHPFPFFSISCSHASYQVATHVSTCTPLIPFLRVTTQAMGECGVAAILKHEEFADATEGKNLSFEEKKEILKAVSAKVYSGESTSSISSLLSPSHSAVLSSIPI